MANYYGLILAGGRGTRFWPRSRTRHPKQVLSVTGDRTLIQATVERLAPLIPAERIWILTNDFVRDEIVRQLPDVPPAQIVSEPAARNTAPAIALAAHILQSVDPEAVFGVFPSDHVIGDSAGFLRDVRTAFEAAEQGSIAVLGIGARYAETGFGYIEFPHGTKSGPPAIPVHKFHEKPDEALAQTYVDARHYYWNAGMFFWRPSTALQALRTHLPHTAALIDSLPPFSDAHFPARMTEVFPQCESVSIDYAVMEKARNAVGVACEDFGWNDVGSWDALYEILPCDENGNAARSPVEALDARGNYVDCGTKTVALIDVDDLIVVDTPDALLITRRGKGQRVGELVKKLEKQGRQALL